MELIPANFDASKVQSYHALSHDHPLVVTAADQLNGELGELDCRFDEASADWMRLDFDPESLVADGEIF